jgi:hypothetical protein
MSPGFQHTPSGNNEKGVEDGTLLLCPLNQLRRANPQTTISGNLETGVESSAEEHPHNRTNHHTLKTPLQAIHPSTVDYRAIPLC